MAALLDEYPKGPFFKYGLSTTGYHVLHAMAP
jgi:hypothetical protein